MRSLFKASCLLNIRLHAARQPSLDKTFSPLRSSIRHASTKQTRKLTITQPWIRLNCSLGEGPFWEEDTNTLRFLDVEKQQVHRVDLNAGPSSHKIVKEFDISIGYVATSYQKSPPTYHLQLHSRYRRQRRRVRVRRQVRLRHRQQANRRVPLDQARLEPRRNQCQQARKVPRQRRRRRLIRTLLGRLHVRPARLRLGRARRTLPP
jgi:hypothetical protein